MSPVRGTGAPVYFVHERTNPRRVVRRIGGAAPVRWLYLGRNYLTLRAWERALGARFIRIPHARRLQQVAQESRRAFLDWIAAVGRQYADLTWWSSRLAERNVSVSPLFRQVCCLRLALEAAGTEDPLLIVTGEWPLLHAIAGQPGLGARIRWLSSTLPGRDWFLWILRCAFVWTRYVIRALRELGDAAASRSGAVRVPPAPRGVRILLHSCMDEECFRDDGAIYDRYFTVLPEEFRRRGYEVVIIPWLFNIRRPRREAFAWFRRFPERYLIPEDYYTLGDYLWAGWVVLSQAWRPRGRQVFAGLEVTGLVRAAARLGAVDTETARFVRYVRLIQRLSSEGFRADIFLDKFENMLTEKPQIIALRTYLPGVRTVGFQHYLAPYQLQMHSFTTPEEAATAPHPDHIICNSAFAADLFAAEGFPRHKLRVGPSVRYLHLLTEGAAQDAPESGAPAVLVILPLDTMIAAEILQKLLDAFPEDRGARFRLKLHPMMTELHWRIALAGRRLPGHMELVRGTMAERIREATCAVVPLGTTAALELLLAGVPLVTVGRDVDLDMNPLAWFEGVRPPVHSAEELGREVEELLASPEHARAACRMWADRWRERVLSPVTEETIRVFVDAGRG